MRYGFFDDANLEYVINRPDTPASWTNYLGARQYGGVITNNAGGYSFYRSSAMGRITRLTYNSIPMDQPGRYFYIRDNDSGEYWSASWQPVGKPLERYASTCRFGLGYAALSSTYADIHADTTYFVPLDQCFEYWLLTLTNEGRTPRRLSVFTYAEFTNEWYIFSDAFNLQYSTYIARTRWHDGFVQYSVNEHLPEDPRQFAKRDQSRWCWMTLRGAEVCGTELQREAFLGPYRSYHNPLAVERGACTGSTAYGCNGCGCMQTCITLAPGESRELMVLLGVGKAAQEGQRCAAEFGTPARAARELDALKHHWRAKITSLQVETPDEDVNHMLNVWGPYNALMNFYWCRAASLIYSGDHRDGFGFRDTVQDLTANAALIPAEVRERLALMLTGQESNGGAMPEVKPYAHTPGAMPLTDPTLQRSDDCLWFFNAIPAYVNETGDHAFYHTVLPYSDAGQDTVFGHLKRALQFNLARTGAHGLPCGLYADWDDCIRMGMRGETVMVALQLRFGLAVYAQIARELDQPQEAAWAEAECAALDARIQKHAWDGAWFLRGYKDTGDVIGAAACEEGRIYHPIQSWAVISGAATPDQARAAMDAVETHLETVYGCMALAPPYVKAECKELRMVLFCPGEKENAGIFNHSQGWIVIANCMLRNAERAFRVYKASLPARFNDLAEIRKIEPYVYSQTTSSRFSQREGMSHIPWLTGSAGWSYFAPTQYLLGIRPEAGGLRIDPCIPAAWPGFRATRIFRGARVAITVNNPNGNNCGVSSLIVNGTRIEGNLIPLSALTHETTVVCALEESQ